MIDGSGSSVNPWPSTDVSKEGRSPKENKTASRAPAASITALSMVLAVWRKSRSAVSSGPKSVNASNVLRIFLKLAPGNASCGGTCEKPELNQVSIAIATQLLVSLVPTIFALARLFGVGSREFLQRNRAECAKVQA